MKKKIIKKTFWSSLGIAVTSLISSWSMNVVLPDAKTTSLTHNQLSTSKRKFKTQKYTTSQPSSPYLKIASDDNGGWKVAGLTDEGKRASSIDIPYGVTEIGVGSFNECNISQISIPNSVRTIDDNAFWRCEKLQSVTIPEGVTKICGNTFQDCTSLSSVTIPESVTDIGSLVFMECNNLRANGVKNYSNVLFEWWVKNHPYGGKTLSQMSSIDLKNYENDNGQPFVTIGGGAFWSCYNLRSITIPESITRLDELAFEECKHLSYVDIPNSVTEIGWGAFQDCADLSSITIPKSVTDIGFNAFRNCTNLKPDGVINNSGVLFDWWVQNHRYASSEGSLVFSKSICLDDYKNSSGMPFTVIGGGAFSDDANLSQITIPNNVVKISAEAFLKCVNLIDISIPGSVKVIGDQAFRFCQRLARITIPNGVTEIDDYAFSCCYNLSSPITIPNSVTKIGYSIFENCEFNKIIFEKNSNFSHVNRFAFSYIRTEVSFYVYEKSTAQILHDAEKWIKIYVTEDQENLVIQYRYDLQKNIKLIGLTENGTKAKQLTIPASITEVAPGAFKNCSRYLKRITFEKGSKLQTVDQYAFGDVPWTTKYYVNDRNVAETLKAANLPPNRIYLPEVKEDDFVTQQNFDNDDVVLVGLTPKGQSERNLVIPSNTTTIANDALRGCNKNLVSVSFKKGSQLKQIEPNAFSGVPSNIQYRFNYLDKQVAENFRSVLKDHVTLVSDQFEISLDGILLHANAQSGQNNLLISKTINNVNVAGIASGAFSDCSSIASIEFEDNIHLNGVSEDVFKGLDINTLIYVHSYDLAQSLAGKTGTCKLAIENGNLLTDYLNPSNLVGLTTTGQTEQVLFIPSIINEISPTAFNCCSEQLCRIIIDSDDIKIDDGAFDSPVIKSILKNIRFYVNNDNVYDALAQNDVQSNQIHLNSSTHHPKKPKLLSSASIVVMIGSFILAVAIISLGVRLVTRRQNKIRMLQAKLNGRRIDRLSTTNAMAFTKITKVTGNINQQVNKLTGKMSLLNAAINPTIKTQDVSAPKSVPSSSSIKPKTTEKVVEPDSSTKK